MLNDNNILQEYIKQSIYKKLYKTDSWFSVKMKFKDKNKQSFLKSIYMDVLKCERHNYKTFEAFSVIFLNFYVLHKNFLKNSDCFNEVLTCHMNKSYYSERKSYTCIPDIIRKLCKTGFVELVNTPFFNDGKNTGQCSKFIILQPFIKMIVKFIEKCGCSEVEVEDRADLIVLRKKINGNKVNVSYVETSIIKKMKQEVLDLNERFACADVQLDIEKAEAYIQEYNTNKFYKEFDRYKWVEGDTEEKVVKKILYKNIYLSMPDLNRNQFHRVFTENFKQNGRMHGHWLHSCPRQFQDLIKINGKATVNLDLSAAHPNILASQEGIQLEGDFYDIPVHQLNIHKTKTILSKQLITDKSEIRKYIKLCVLTFINCSGNTHEQEQALNEYKQAQEYFDTIKEQHDVKNKEYKKAYKILKESLRKYNSFFNEYKRAMSSKGMYPHEAMIIKDLFVEKYPWIEKYICTGQGVKCMFHEATVMDNILVKLMLECDKVVIPLYDGLICEGDIEEGVRRIIRECWKDYFGTEIQVSEK